MRIVGSLFARLVSVSFVQAKGRMIVARNAQGQVLFLRSLPHDARLGSPKGTRIPPDQFHGWDQIFIQAGDHFAIDPYFIKAILLVESGLRKTARSHAGAIGPAQFMPHTAARIGVEDPYDPTQAIWGCAAYLRRLSDYFNGDMRLMAAGYNAGEGAVQKAGNKIPNIKETQKYVPNVLWTWDRLQRV